MRVCVWFDGTLHFSYCLLACLLLAACCAGHHRTAPPTTARPPLLSLCAMPPRAPLQTSFSVTDVNNEVVCPLRNQDGSHCRKRCLGVSLVLSRYTTCYHCYACIPCSPLPSLLLSNAASACCDLSSIDSSSHILSSIHHPRDIVVTMHASTGEALPLHARAHPPCPPRVLHPQAACHERELRAYDNNSSP